MTSGFSSVGAGSIGAQFPQSVVSIPTKQIWPYIQQWHFDVQHELPTHIVATVSYVGSKGTHLGQRYDLNQIRPTPASANPIREKGSRSRARSLAQQSGSRVVFRMIAQSDRRPEGRSFPVTTLTVIPHDQTPGTPGVNMYVACGNNPDFFRPIHWLLGYSSAKKYGFVDLPWPAALSDEEQSEHCN